MSEIASQLFEERFRNFSNHAGRRRDLLFMGILREDWLRQNMEASS